MHLVLECSFWVVVHSFRAEIGLKKGQKWAEIRFLQVSDNKQFSQVSPGGGDHIFKSFISWLFSGQFGSVRLCLGAICAKKTMLFIWHLLHFLCRVNS